MVIDNVVVCDEREDGRDGYYLWREQWLIAGAISRQQDSLNLEDRTKVSAQKAHLIQLARLSAALERPPPNGWQRPRPQSALADQGAAGEASARSRKSYMVEQALTPHVVRLRTLRTTSRG